MVKAGSTHYRGAMRFSSQPLRREPYIIKGDGQHAGIDTGVNAILIFHAGFPFHRFMYVTIRYE
jgi:hypothetical protein